ncbi:MAG: AI-2E family transporter [Erysipelotrichaceae bacterium]|nr:AI-2E family transporter [Erysipelotrichaceae bacterium]
MNIASRIRNRLKEDFSLQGLMKVALVLVIILLFQATAGIWKGLFGTLFRILKPFLYGFVVAYILRRVFIRLEMHKIPRGISVPVVYLLLILALIWLLSSLIPMLLSRTSAFIGSMISSINWVTEHLSSLTSSDIPPWISAMIDTGVSTLSDFKNLIPSLTGTLPDVVQATIGIFTTLIITTVVSIFMSLEWEKIRFYIVTKSSKISLRFYLMIFEVDEEIGEYLHSMLTLILIRFAEYTLLYLLVGHPDWLILGILTAVSVFIPYIGPIIVSTLGIIIALTQSWTMCLILSIAIVILSQVDEYVIAPLVHARNTHISPLWTLFSIFAGGNLLGVPGIIIAIPAFLTIRTIYRIYIKEEEEETSAEDEV